MYLDLEKDLPQDSEYLQCLFYGFSIIHDTLDGNSFLRSMDNMDFTADNCPWIHPEAFLIWLVSDFNILPSSYSKVKTLMSDQYVYPSSI